MKCIVCGTRMHFQHFIKVLKDDNFLRGHNEKKPVTTENIKKNIKLGSSDHILGQLNHINHVKHTNHVDQSACLRNF